jgi:cytochrome P450
MNRPVPKTPSATAGDTSHKSLLTAHEQLVDPYGGFGRIREETRIARGMWGGSPAWFITRFDDANAVLTDRRFVSDSGSLPGGTDVYAEVLGKLGIDEGFIPHMVGNLAVTDPPDHTRMRRLVSRAFSARRISAMRPRVEAIVAELLDALPGHAVNGTVDLIAHLTDVLSMTVICELVGVPAQDRTRWRDWSRDYSSMDAQRINAMLAGTSAYIRDLAARRRVEPADDLVTGLIQAHDEDSDRLSDGELITMVLTLVVAGHETTPPLLGNGILALLTHPDQLALLREDPTLMPGAVQEVLRWCSPATLSKLRYAAEDVTIGDTLIKQGDRVQVVLGSANHDPRRYSHPEELDVTRRPDTAGVPHLSYARGAHHCLGAGLANQEIEVAFNALFGRYPDLALAVPPDRLKWKAIPLTRQLAELPVVLGAPS